jgi:hypothetical protein
MNWWKYNPKAENPTVSEIDSFIIYELNAIFSSRKVSDY